MQHYKSLDNIHLPQTWLTIGSFDGVHRGHQVLIRGLVEEAHAAGMAACVLTFFPHPAVVLRGQQGPFYLNTPEEKAALLGELGVDAVITLQFDRTLAALSAREFVTRLTESLPLRRLCIGYDFALGRGREGDAATLRRLGQELGYELDILPRVEIDGGVVSSSQIRSLLLSGSVERAAHLLGRWYALEGQVIRGDGRGKGLGFPTANLKLWPEQMVPAAGIYACWAWVNGERHAAATNVGVRPTFETQSVETRVEAFLLDFDRDLYGQSVRLEFVSYLREELRFSSVEALITQMHQDVRDTREKLENGS